MSVDSRWASDPEKNAASWETVNRSLNAALSTAVTYESRDAIRTAQRHVGKLKEANSSVSSDPGMNIRHYPRCSTADRMRYAEHLVNMFADGFLSKEEWELRHDACMAAVVRDDLKPLLRDLPPLPPEIVKQEIPPPGPAGVPKMIITPMMTGFTSACVLAASIGNPGSLAQWISELGLAASIVAVTGMLAGEGMKARKKGTK